MKTFISLTKQGTMTSFEGDFPLPLKGEKVKRISHVLPANPLKRAAFRILRFLFGDKGRIADWTRRWKGPWIVVINGIEIGTFNNRQEAISYERELVIRRRLWRSI